MISNILFVPEHFFSLIKKAFSHDKGALIIISAPISLLTNYYSQMKIFETLRINDAILEIMSANAVKSLLFTLIAFGVLTCCYILVSLIDFYTGLKASRKEWLLENESSRGYIKSDKLWSSVWKFVGVMVIGSIITIFCSLFALANLEWLFEIFSLLLILFYFVVITFDVHSIGENHLRRYGYKPAFYGFLDNISKTVKSGIIQKIKNKFN